MKIRGRITAICLLLILFIAIIMSVTSAQPEPPSPEEEWFPPPPEEEYAPHMPPAFSISEAGTGVPGAAGTVNVQIIDERGRTRREVYGTERFCLQFTSPYATFYLYLYEWYPPGVVPRGHWLIYQAGPYRLWEGAIVKICYFQPEADEPEGQHTWRLWLYNPVTRSRSSGICRFNYFRFPRASIERVEIPPDIVIGANYELKVTVKNLGEVDHQYTLTIEGFGVSLDRSFQDVRIPASSTVTVSFRFTPATASPRIEIKLLSGMTVLETKAITLAARVLTPGPMTLGDISPVVLREGEEAVLTLTFINRGQGKAVRVFGQIEAPGFQVISGTESVPDVEAGSSARAIFRVRPIEGGVKTVRITITYADIVGNKYSDTIESTVTVLVRLRVDSKSKDGTSINIPVTVNGEEKTRFDEWINPREPVTLEAKSEVLSEGMKYVFTGWSDGSTTPRRTIYLQKSSTISAIYTIYCRVTAVSPYSKVLGEGWYEKGSTATISIEQTSIGFGIKQVFDHWEDEKGNILTTAPSYSFIVTEPKTLKAVWRTDYTELILLMAALAAVSLIAILLLRRRRLPPPPPPPPV